jgi:mannitol/fructose-specific phosphotransferase system IIA component (Ntr-type)
VTATIRESEHTNGHMKIFSRLARRMMHEDFRERLVKEQNPAALCALLNESLKA